jgi:hypothetical protein
MRSAFIRMSFAFFAIFLASGTPAEAKDRDVRKGEGIVDKVNAGGRTIMVNLEEYAVPLDCEINRESGEVVALAKLRGAMRPGLPLVETSEVDFVVFKAVKERSGWAMTKIVLLDEVPE